MADVGLAGRPEWGNGVGEMFFRLLLLFITIPLIELVLFLEIGSRIGLPVTLGIVVATGFLGAWLTRHQGMRTLARFRRASAEGRLPHQEVLDGIMILVAGAVLLTPGFLTDVFGFLLLVPAVRAPLRRWLTRRLKDRITVVTGAGGGVPGSAVGGAGGSGAIRESGPTGGMRRAEGRVVEPDPSSEG